MKGSGPQRKIYMNGKLNMGAGQVCTQNLRFVLLKKYQKFRRISKGGNVIKN